MDFSPKQVEMIREKFDLMADEDLTLNKEDFKQLLKINKDDEVNKVLKLLTKILIY